MNALESLKYFHPELWLVSGAVGVLFLDFFFKNKRLLGFLSLIIVAAAAVSAVLPSNSRLFFGFFELDAFTHFFRYAALGIVGLTILLSLSFKPLHEYLGEYYSLFLFMAFGLILMASSTNLLMIFLAIEFVSILSYLLVGYSKRSEKGKEAAIKYFLFGSAASAMMLFGMSLLFGASGSMDIREIQSLLGDARFYPLTVIASLLFLAGVGFKISMVPFHFWAPDVYEGAPTPVTAFLTVGPKALGFAILLRLFEMMFPWLGMKWTAVISLLSILTMTIGNLSAIIQTNVKRLLAFSSIAQAGYILMGLAASTAFGMQAVLIYILAYAVTNLGAFAIVIIVSNQTGSDEIESYAGLSKRSPFLAMSLTVFLLSLAGIPPLAGFIGKFYVFSAVLNSNLIMLAVFAALNSAVAAYYYFKIVRVMYLVETSEGSKIEISVSHKIAVGLLLAGIVLMGLFPSFFISLLP